MRYALGAIPDPVDERDFRYSRAVAAMTAAVEHTLPPYIDNRSQCGPLKDQGQVPACVGFSLSSLAEFLYWRQRARLEVLSAWAAYNGARVHDDFAGYKHPGSTLAGGLEWWRKVGQVPHDCLPEYRGADAELCADAARLSRGNRLWRHERLGSIPEVKHAIHQHGAVVATVMVTEAWERVSSATDYLIEADHREVGWHAVMYAGYEQDGFIVKNSWRDWGKEGFARLSYEDHYRHCHDTWVAILRQSWIGLVAGWMRRLSH